MSTNRVSKQAGWVDQRTHPKGPNGRGLCRQCGEEVPPRSRTFCSQACVDAWKIKTDPGHVRVLVFQRDKGVCAACGLDTVAWARERSREWGALQHHVTELPYHEASMARQRFRTQYPHYFNRRSHWDADHIVPVVEGGGECDLDNYRTLCIPCHKRVTAELAARRAEARRPERDARERERQEQRRRERELQRRGMERLF